LTNRLVGLLRGTWNSAAWPRQWWHLEPQEIVFGSEEEKATYHGELSKSLRTSMMSLIVFSLFCLLTIGAPDSQLIVENNIRIPFANVSVSFKAFVITAPLLLIAITLYLHLFLGHLLRVRDLETTRKLPYLFNLDGPLARIASNALFYLLPPVVLFVFLWKTLPFGFVLQFLLMMLAFPATVGLSLLYLKRSRATMRSSDYWTLWLLVFLISVIGCHELALLAADGVNSLERHWREQNLAVFHEYTDRSFLNRSLFMARGLVWDASVPRIFVLDLEDRWIWRPLRLENQVLDGKDFEQQDLSFASMERASLLNVNFMNANLRGAKLGGAKLRGANLRGVYLGLADLSGADLSGADLRKADLRWANLDKANVARADLRECRWLQCAILRKAKNWPQAYRDQRLTCGSSVPEHPTPSE
jgi:hypothetical protein